MYFCTRCSTFAHNLIILKTKNRKFITKWTYRSCLGTIFKNSFLFLKIKNCFLFSRLKNMFGTFFDRKQFFENLP